MSKSKGRMSDKKRRRKLLKRIIRSMREFDSLGPTQKEWAKLSNELETILFPSKDPSEEEE